MERFTDEEVRRYGRQMVLAEWGGVGQERVRAARVVASDEVEALYLAGAGVGTLIVPSAEIAASVRALNPLLTVEISGAPAESSVEESCGRALETLKQILGLSRDTAPPSAQGRPEI